MFGGDSCSSREELDLLWFLCELGTKLSSRSLMFSVQEKE